MSKDWAKGLKLSAAGWRALRVQDPTIADPHAVSRANLWMQDRPEKETDRKFSRRINRLVKRFELRQRCHTPGQIAWFAYTFYRIFYGKNGNFRGRKNVNASNV